MVAGPLHPAAVAVIFVVPLQPAAKVATPVALFIVFPPARLVASRLYTIAEELFVAVVV